MQAQQKLGSLVYRPSKGSFSKKMMKTSTGNSFLSPSSSPTRSSDMVRSDQDLSDLWRRESGMSQVGRSGILAQLRKGSCCYSSMSDSTLCDKRVADRVDLRSSLVRMTFFLVSCCKVDKVLDAAVGCFRRNVHHVPCIMRLKFIQVLFGKDKASVPNSLDGMTCSSSFDNQPPTSGGLSDWPTGFKDVNVYDEFVTSVAIVSANEDEDDQDDYGFFADFDDDKSQRDEHVFHCNVWRPESCMSSLCTLEEAEEEEG